MLGSLSCRPAAQGVVYGQDQFPFFRNDLKATAISRGHLFDFCQGLGDRRLGFVFDRDFEPGFSQSDLPRLAARLLARKAPGDLFESRKENAVSSSNRTFFLRNAHGISQTRDIH
jgi:hypothetical protein